MHVAKVLFVTSYCSSAKGFCCEAAPSHQFCSLLQLGKQFVFILKISRSTNFKEISWWECFCSAARGAPTIFGRGCTIRPGANALSLAALSIRACTGLRLCKSHCSPNWAAICGPVCACLHWKQTRPAPVYVERQLRLSRRLAAVRDTSEIASFKRPAVGPVPDLLCLSCWVVTRLNRCDIDHLFLKIVSYPPFIGRSLAEI